MFSPQSVKSPDMVSVLGVQIKNCSRREAIELMENLIKQESNSTQNIFIVNAHTLNLATEDEEYRKALNSAYRVYGDGTGVRWAARLHGIQLKENLVGTDLIPQFLRATAGKSYRYFLLGSGVDAIDHVAKACTKTFPGWDLVGSHHGYFKEDDTKEVIKLINTARPHLLLVGMGNPKQESWAHAHREELRVPVCVGVGGLFDHWSGNLARAPFWVRRLGFEWLQILIQQPHKWRRYLIGNPKFLMRIAREYKSGRVRNVKTP